MREASLLAPVQEGADVVLKYPAEIFVAKSKFFCCVCLSCSLCRCEFHNISVIVTPSCGMVTACTPLHLEFASTDRREKDVEVRRIERGHVSPNPYRPHPEH